MLIILLSTYNGSQYIREQLDSLVSQSYSDFQIIIRDDGSSDNTVEIIQSYSLEKIELLKSSENLGVRRSFNFLLEYAIKNTNAQYFMFCDQDDIWKKNKIKNTLARIQELENKNSSVPLLVYTDLEVVDKNMNTINNSFMNFQKLDPYKTLFHNILMQNTIAGCTLMINKKLAELASPIPNVKNISLIHDVWMALVASQFGVISYINEQSIKYRQHEVNSVGAKKFNLDYILHNIKQKQLLQNNIGQAKVFLKTYEKLLDAATLDLLEEFISLENCSYFKKRYILFKHKLFKHGLLRNIGLLVKL